MRLVIEVIHLQKNKFIREKSFIEKNRYASKNHVTSGCSCFTKSLSHALPEK